MDFNYDSGVYVLKIFLSEKQKIKIGAKGVFDFPAGYYYYCGTAQRNLQARLKRHGRQEKKFHWHIDYLLAEAKLQEFYTWPVSREGECRLARYFIDELEGEVIVPGFGASDCDCKSHLIYFSNPVVDNKMPGDNIFE